MQYVLRLTGMLRQRLDIAMQRCKPCRGIHVLSVQRHAMDDLASMRRQPAFLQAYDIDVVMPIDGNLRRMASLGEETIFLSLHRNSSGDRPFKPHRESFHECLEIALCFAQPGCVQVEITGKTAQSHAP